MPPNDPIDIIATQILFDAKGALAELKKFNADVTDSGKKITALKSIIAKVSQQMGGDLKGATAAVQKFGNAFTGINPQLIKTIGKELQLLDNIAKKSLGDMSGKTLESSTRMTLLSNAIQQMAAKGKISIDQVTRSLQMLNASKGTQFQFGKLGFSPDEINKAGQAAQATANSLDQVNKKAKEAGASGNKAGKDIESGFAKSVTAVNALRIAMGVLVSMIIFQVIQAFQSLVNGALNGLKELEVATYNLIGAEQRLSEAGIEITPKGLDETIKKLQELDPLLSKIQAYELVSRVAANVAPQVGFDAKQISELSEAVSILAIKNKALGYSFDEVEKSVTDAFLTGKVSQSINKFGVKINDQIVKDEALRMGLVKTADEFDNLTGKMEANIKAAAMLSILKRETDKEIARLPEFLKTADAAFGITQARLSDLLTTVGSQFAPVLIEVFTAIANRLENINEWLVKNQGNVKEFMALSAGAIRAFAALSDTSLTERIFSPMKVMEEVFGAFRDGYNDAKEGTEDLATAADTATGAVEDLAGVDDDETLKTLEEIDDKLREIAIDAQHAREDLEVALSQKQADLEIKFTQKQQDIDTEYQRKEEDAARDLQRKISDIERDAERERQRVLEKAREEEHKAEEDHQLKLWELKMRYLMDLEDALHARDARQVIRLQREYELDKELLEKKKQQEDEERQTDLEADLQAVEDRKQERLEDAQIEYEQKIADLIAAKARELEELNIWKAREEADLKIWYERELEEIDRQVQQKIEKLLAGYIEEQKIHSENQEAIHQILLKYFGKNMALVDSLVAYTAQAFANMGALSFQANPVATGYSPLAQDAITAHNLGEKGYAEGGTVIATRPTRALFGERGAEMATFTPLNRTGRDVNKVFGDASNGGGEGRIALDILLSPDLEARIIENSMDGVADVIASVNRSKV